MREANERGTTVLAKQIEISISQDYGEGIWRNSEENFHRFDTVFTKSNPILQMV